MAVPLLPLTIDDTSPLISYAPFGDTFSAPDTAKGWNPYYDISGFAALDSGANSVITDAIGNGTSLHVTASDGAALQIAWNGTDITLFGTLIQSILQAAVDSSPATYIVVLDGAATTNFISSFSQPPTLQNASTDVLVQFTGLNNGAHTLQLVLRNTDNTDTSGNATTGIIAFDRAVMEANAGLSSPPASSSLPATPASTPSPSATASTASVPDDAVAYRGQWSFVQGLLPDSSAGFHTSNNAGDRATLAFNGSAIGLTGLTTPASGAYNVSLDNGEPVTFSARASFTSSAPTLLFFQAGLDLSVMHTVEVVNAGPTGAGDGAGSLLVLGAVNVTTVQNPAATAIGAPKRPNSLSRGGIAALAIGLTLAVAALAAAVVIFMRRRRRSARHKRQMLVNPQIKRARSGRLSFLFPPLKRPVSEVSVVGAPTMEMDREGRKALEGGYAPGGVLDIRSPTLGEREKAEDSDSEGEEEGGEDEGRRFSAAKGKRRATQRSNASKNSDGSYSIELTIAQVPRGYVPPSQVPSTPSPPRTTMSSPTSPRSPARPRGPRDLPGRDVTRGILLSNLASVPPPVLSDEAGHFLAVPSYLPEAHISPLRVEFASDVQDRSEARTERTISTSAMSLPQSLKQALGMATNKPPPLAIQTTAQPPALTLQTGSEPLVPAPQPPSPSLVQPDRIYSFLDFSSTSTSLSRSQRHSESNSTGKSRSSSRSKHNTGSDLEHTHTVNWASLPPDRRISLGLSMTLGGGGTASRPSLSPNVSLHPVPLSQLNPALAAVSTSPDPSSPDSPNREQDFPYDSNQLPSPTDSVPYTVSDIHFRHSTHSSISMPADSRRASAYRLSGSHRPPHPPLPNSAGPSSPTRATHRKGGNAHGPGGSSSQSATVPPPFIVQRILGRAPGSPFSPPGSPFSSPTTPQFASMTGTMRATATATTNATATAASAGTSGTGTGTGNSSPASQVQRSTVPESGPSGQTSASGSTTTVFGFQLGRHR